MWSRPFFLRNSKNEKVNCLQIANALLHITGIRAVTTVAIFLSPRVFLLVSSNSSLEILNYENKNYCIKTRSQRIIASFFAFFCIFVSVFSGVIVITVSIVCILF